MGRIILLLGIIILVASFPLINYWLSHYTKKDHYKIDKEIIESVVDNYISSHPERIIASLSNMRSNEHHDNTKIIKQYNSELHDSTYPAFGNLNSKLTIVEFFDYSCGYCKIMEESIKKIISDNKVRVIFRDLPVLGPNSYNAARSALAVHFIDPKKYIDFYYSVLSSKEPSDSATILKIVEKIGIKEEDFKKSLNDNSEKIEKMLNDTKHLATNLHINGTPSMVVGDHLFIGAVDLETLQNKINDLLS